jgi:Spy/CpxP family protein refolding chaperone
MGGHHGRHHHSFMHALKSVSLTPDQQKQVDAFKAQEAKANAGADRSTKEANAAKMRQQIMGILTPDQKAQVQDAMHGSSAMSAGAMSAVTPAPH